MIARRLTTSAVDSARAAASTSKPRKRKHVEVKIEEEEVASGVVDDAPEDARCAVKAEPGVDSALAPSPPSSSPRKRPKGSATPERFEQQIANIFKMREKRDAVVDTMGCERLADRKASPEDFRFQTLVSLMLSSQTKDEVTSAAVGRLIDAGCSAEHIAAMDDKTLSELIYPVGFWRKKTVYLKKTAQMLLDEFAGDIPNSVKGLTSLPGVGPKMAHICMHVAWDQQEGLGVDTHVHRICGRLGWTAPATAAKTPEHTRVELEEWLPPHYWKDVNILLVGFGQQTCRPVGPRCGECLNNQCCPHAWKTRKHWQKKE